MRDSSAEPAREPSSTYAIFSANYPPNVGGVEKYTQNLARTLAELGDRAIVVTNNVFGLAEIEQECERVDIVRLPCRNVMNGRYPLPRKNEDYGRLLKWLNEQPVDYVIVNTRFYIHSLLGIRLAESKGIKPIVIDHGSAHLTMGNRLVDVFVSAYEHAFTSIIKRHEVDYYAVSQAGVRWLNHFGIAAKGTLCNSIDAVQFKSSASARDFRKELDIGPEDFLVSFTGRFIPEKGIGPLMDAAEALAQHGDIRFALAGEGPLEQEITEKNLPNVHIVGRLSSPDVAALLLASDAFCLPTRSEGFSTSLLEAAACGTVPIVTNVGGVDELMPSNSFGIVLQQAKKEDVEESILALCKDRSLCCKMANCINRRVREEFSWQSTALKTAEACKRANGA